MDTYEPRHALPSKPTGIEFCPMCEDTPGFSDVESAEPCRLCFGKGWLPPAE